MKFAAIGESKTELVAGSASCPGIQKMHHVRVEPARMTVRQFARLSRIVQRGAPIPGAFVLSMQVHVEHTGRNEMLRAK